MQIGNDTEGSDVVDASLEEPMVSMCAKHVSEHKHMRKLHTSQRVANGDLKQLQRPDKTSPKNNHLRNGDYFSITAFSSHSTLLTSMDW